MTDAEAIQRSTETPHLNAEYFAYYSGRNAGEFGDKCEFTRNDLRQAWARGYGEVRREMVLNEDTEWD